jgi:hypothetical protein
MLLPYQVPNLCVNMYHLVMPKIEEHVTNMPRKKTGLKVHSYESLPFTAKWKIYTYLINKTLDILGIFNIHTW